MSVEAIGGDKTLATDLALVNRVCSMDLQVSFQQFWFTEAVGTDLALMSGVQVALEVADHADNGVVLLLAQLTREHADRCVTLAVLFELGQVRECHVTVPAYKFCVAHVFQLVDRCRRS